MTSSSRPLHPLPLRPAARPLRMLVLLLLCWASAQGCTVPVFRYALERWAPSPYELWIFHRGAPDARLAGEIEALLRDGSAQANVTVEWVDVGGAMSPAAALAWNGQQPLAMPHATLRFAPHGAATGVAFAGPATPDTVRSLLVSPARQRVIDHLTGGDSAVWLFVESGDAAADAAALARLSATLAAAEQELKLPDPAADDSGEATLAAGGTPLRISFPIVRIARTTAEEAGFVALLGATFTPPPAAGQPFTVMVSGQGRAIARLAGDEIDPNYINAWCGFVAGACSCQVKAELPGSDLLLRADWSRLRDGPRVQDAQVPNIATLPAAVTTPGRAPGLAPPPAGAPAASGLLERLLWWSLAAGGLLLGLTGWHFLRSRAR